ncbi:FecR domain-containing protein [Sphingopyxis sp. BSNA05]|uniref:FecR family protein n=1 Tax=Sphingopyxis sp. BSNA05 TaxID=1236614 RepID=UPI001564B363|nr:FecR family protein [Sphingopyxis sp. BSNA05]
MLLISGQLAAQTVEGAADPQDAPEVQAELLLLDAEIVESSTEGTALQLAAKQIESKDLSGAATTLERYLITDPESLVVRVEYAIILCRLDDLQAGRFEVAKIAENGLDQPTANRVQAECQITASDMPALKTGEGRVPMRNFRNRNIAILVSGTMITSPLTAQTVGMNSAVRNNVELQQTATGAAQKARIRQPVKMRNVVTTAAASTLQITLLDRSSLTVGPNARLTVNRFVYDPKAKSSSVGTTLVKGTLRFLSGKSARGGRNSINTPAASIGIRGTMVELAVGEDAVTIGKLQPGLVMGGKVDPQTASLIVLRGPGPKAQLGEESGIIDVTAAGKTVTITQPGMAVFVPFLGAAPSAPFQLSNGAYGGFDNMLRTTPSASAPASQQSSSQQSPSQNANSGNTATSTSTAGSGSGAGAAGAAAGTGAGIGSGAVAGILGALAAGGLVAATSTGSDDPVEVEEEDPPVSP